MTTSNYPDGYDEFIEPSIPESTSLSSAGTGNFNHPESHTHMGDAIEQLEHYAAQRTHDHSGDATDPKKGSKLNQSATHENPDTDTSNGIHHTLGVGANQAAAGNHHHDYNDGSIENTPWRTCTSTTRPGTPWAGLMVYETDTNVVRVWSQFLANQLITGLNSLEQFNQGANSTDIGTTLWEQWYTSGDLSHGRLATPDGQTMSWIDGGNQTNACIARRINVADAQTQGDDQALTFKTGTIVIENDLIIPGIDGATNDFFLRMSADRQSYWRFRVANGYIKVSATTSGYENEFLLGEIHSIDTAIASMEWRIELKDRTISFYKLGQFMGAVTDSKAVTSKGADYRGWGVGAQAGARGLGQTTPSNIDWVRIADLALYSSIYRWTVLPLATIPVVRLRQTVKQNINPNGTILQWSAKDEDSFNYFSSGTPTDIAITEPGLYQLDMAIQWDPQVVPDTATVVACVNGAETPLQNSRFQRGGAAPPPGFSQTMSLDGKLRLAIGDVVTIKARYTASSGLGAIFSYFDAPTKVNSRLELHYISP